MNYSSSVSSVLPANVDLPLPSPDPAIGASESLLNDVATHYTSETLMTATAPVASPASPQDSSPSRSQRFEIFLSTFFTIFLAELGDKTQVTTLLMTAESHAPWIVFAGAGAALVLTSFLGVWVGCWLAKRVAPRTLETLAGAMLLGISVLLLWDVIQL